MSADDYRQHLTAIITAAKIVGNVPIDKILDAMSRSHALGPILDPTAYQRGAKKMDEDREIVNAALPLWRLAQRLGEAS